MKSVFLKTLALVFVLTMVCTSVFAVNANGIVIKLQIDNPIMTVNSENAEIDPGRGTVPVIVNGRTLVPVRAIIEAMGGAVGWNAEKAEVTLIFKNDTITLAIGSDIAYLNDVQSTLDAIPVVMNERTMLPIRYIAESFKFDVQWDDVLRTITISEQAENVFMEEPENFHDELNAYDEPYDEIYDEFYEEEELEEEEETE